MNIIFNCELEINTICDHLYQLYTGLSELASSGIIKLNIKKNPGFRPYNSIHPKAYLTLNDNIRIVYEMTDGDVIPDDIDLDNIDLYFKRSLNRNVIKNNKNKHKFHPFGLNYSVLSKNTNKLLTTKKIKIEEIIAPFFYKFPAIAKLLGLQRLGIAYINDFTYIPEIKKDPVILFMTRAFPVEKYNNDDNIHQLNIMRAECIEKLKREFGKWFYGGFAYDNYSSSNYPNSVLKDPTLSFRKTFLQKVKESDICISTTGLFGSIGWKMAEYVAASKAIISEQLLYEVPGNFANNNNYLEFTNSDDLFKQIYRLIDDPQYRYNMMINNYRYYNNYVRPDSVVLNSIFIAYASKINNNL